MEISRVLVTARWKTWEKTASAENPTVELQESCRTQQRAAVSRICFMKRHVRLKSIAPKWSQEKKLKEMKIDQAIYKK